MTDKRGPFRARPQPPSELDEPFRFLNREAPPPGDKHEDFREAAADLQRQLDHDAERAVAEEQDPYLRLPPSIRAVYSRQEYLWLSDMEKATLVQRECEPEE